MKILTAQFVEKTGNKKITRVALSNKIASQKNNFIKTKLRFKNNCKIFFTGNIKSKLTCWFYC